ncbi:MAG: hypothetical protein ACRC2G_15240, partial [Aestuariivirga sp.]
DGTLADLTHRRPLVDGSLGCKDWPAFHAACVNDSPIWPVIRTMKRLMASGCEVWIVSGRSDEVRPQTCEWLAHHNCWPHTLLMRKAGDYTPDDALKESWLLSWSEADRSRIEAVFDDRDRVVAMWRRNGLQCFQVAPGDF